MLELLAARDHVSAQKCGASHPSSLRKAPIAPQVITITTDPSAVCSPTLFPVNYPGALAAPPFALPCDWAISAAIEQASLGSGPCAAELPLWPPCCCGAACRTQQLAEHRPAAHALATCHLPAPPQRGSTAKRSASIYTPAPPCRLPRHCGDWPAAAGKRKRYMLSAAFQGPAALCISGLLAAGSLDSFRPQAPRCPLH